MIDYLSASIPKSDKNDVGNPNKHTKAMLFEAIPQYVQIMMQSNPNIDFGT